MLNGLIYHITNNGQVSLEDVGNIVNTNYSRVKCYIQHLYYAIKFMTAPKFPNFPGV